MTTHHNTSIQPSASIYTGSPFSLLTQAISTWYTNSRNRNDYISLLNKTDSELEDIGIARSWLQKEVRKNFWQN